MPCLKPDGTLTEAAASLMRAIEEYDSLEEIARATDIPLYLVRATARDLINAGLAVESDGKILLTEFGLGKLK